MTQFVATILIANKIPPTLNEWQRVHWSRHQELKKEWSELLIIHSMIQGVKIPPATEKCKRSVRVQRFSTGNPDPASTKDVAGKVILDPMRSWEWRKVGKQRVMVQGKLCWIWDDDPDHCEFEVVPVRVEHRDDIKTIVTVRGEVA